FNRRPAAAGPLAGTIHKCETFVFAFRSTSSQSNTTHFPSGDGTGAPTRFNAIMSSNVNGRLAVGCPTALMAKPKTAITTNIILMLCSILNSRRRGASVSLGSTRLWRVGFGVPPKRPLRVSDREDAIASTRDAYAPQRLQRRLLCHSERAGKRTSQSLAFSEIFRDVSTSVDMTVE